MIFNKSKLIEIWQKSYNLNCEIHGYFNENNDPTITQIGNEFNVLVDCTKTNTFHTHLDTPNRMNDIIEFAGCDPPSGQDFAVLLTRYNANKAHQNSDSVISRYGLWKYSISANFFNSNPILNYKNNELLKSYYQWCQLLLLCGFFTIDQYIERCQNFNPIHLSNESEEFLNEGLEAQNYVYDDSVYETTCLFPLNKDNQSRYQNILVETNDIKIIRNLW